ncbi:MAG: hypothetical protein U0263_41840 [Polyangiaceae bacterium]
MSSSGAQCGAGTRGNHGATRQPRTKANVPLAISRGKITFTARCVELSQTGLLAKGPRELFDTPWQYASARLILGAER